MNDECVYSYTFCGKEIAVPIDLPAGTEQDYVDDCPECSHPNMIHVQVEDDGSVQVRVTVPLPKNEPLVPFDVVQEASEKSFPASDAPAY